MQLPGVLTIEEEATLLQQLPAEEAKRTLIEHNLRLVMYVAKKFENTGVDFDDLFSIGAIGLIKAVNTFKTDKNIKLATYTARCIENEILMYLRKQTKWNMMTSIDAPISTDYEGNELFLSDLLGTEENMVFRDLEKETDTLLLQTGLGKLRPLEKQVVLMSSGIGCEDKQTQLEIAEQLDFSQSYVSRIRRKALNKLKKTLKALEY